MAFSWIDLLPSIIGGGFAAGGALIASRGAREGAEIGAEGGRYAADLQFQTAQQNLDLMRQIYNQDIRLNWPAIHVSTGALKKLSTGMGIQTPEGIFDVQTDPFQLDSLGVPGADGAGDVDGGGFSNLPPTSLVRPGSTLGAVGRGAMGAAGLGGMIGGSALGAKVGLVGGPVGSAIGAGIGAAVGGLSGLIGRGRKEADTIVPYQEALTREFDTAIRRIKAKEAAGALTAADWQAEIDRLDPLYQEYQGLTQKFGRAGPGGQESTAYMGDMLNEWRGYAGGTPGRMHGGPVYKRQRGGFTRPQQDYLVGEVGPEFYDRGQPGPPYEIVGENGPEIRTFPEDGMIIPNHKIRYIPPRAGGFRRPGRLIPRAEGGQVSPELELPPNMVRADPATATNWYGGVPVKLLPTAPAPGTTAAEHRAGMIEYGQPGAYVNKETIEAWKGLGPGFYNPALDRGVYDPAKDPEVQPGGMFYAPKPTDPEFAPYVPPAAKPPLDMGGYKAALKDYGMGMEPFNKGFREWTDPFVPPEREPYVPLPSYGGFLNPGKGPIPRQAGGPVVKQPTVIDVNTGLPPLLGPVDYPSPTAISPRNPYTGMEAPYDPTEGEFMRPWGEEFSFDPESAGFMAFNKKFSFDPADLYSDPSYQHRLDEGRKGVERAGSRRGMTLSGRALKEMDRFSQDYASTEFPKAYQRAQQEFGLSYEQAQQARNRALDEYIRRYTIDRKNQQDRFNRLAAIAGAGQEP